MIFIAVLCDKLQNQVHSLEGYNQRQAVIVRESTESTLPPLSVNLFIWRHQQPWFLRRATLNSTGRINSWILLIIAGIETNPGPIICTTCLRTVAKTHRHIKCADCQLIRHIKCANVTPDEYKLLKGHRRDWICFSCALPKYDESLFGPSSCNDSSTSHYSDLSLSTPGEAAPSNPLNIKLEKGLRIRNLNIQGLRSCVDSFRLSLSESPFDCVGLCETNLGDTAPDSQFEIPGYSMERKDGTTRHTHGILLYVAENLTTRRRTDLEVDQLDCLWCEIRLPKTRPLLIGSVYKSPSADAQHLIDFQDNISKAPESGLETIILGDFNLDLLSKRKDSSTKQFSQFMRSNAMKQVVDKPTRVTEKSSTMIDHVYLNHEDKLVSSSVISTGLTDHMLIYVIRRAVKPRFPRGESRRGHSSISTKKDLRMTLLMYHGI